MFHTRVTGPILCLFLSALAPHSIWGQDSEQPLFTFVQVSDSQPETQQHQTLFDEVVATVLQAGNPGALLPHPVGFVLFAGDLVDVGTTAQWNTFVATMLPLADAQIPYLAVPGNHDRTGGGLTLYEQFVTGREVWDVSSWAFVGHNGVPWAGGTGLRIIGVNNADSGEVTPEDVSEVNARVAQAEANDENVIVLAHFPHDANGIPLRQALENRSVVAYLRGHTGFPFALNRLAGVNNPGLWECNTNSIKRDGALIYFEAYSDHLRAYVLELEDNPSSLPTPRLISWAHPLPVSDPGDPGDPGDPAGELTLNPTDDAKVVSNEPRKNFGADTNLRVRSGSGAWRSFLRFELPELGASAVEAATLRLFVVNSSPRGGDLFTVTPDWSESTLTDSNAPTPDPTVVDSLGVVHTGDWVEFDVTTALSGSLGGEALAFALTSSVTNSAYYSSREGSNPPELHLELTEQPLAFGEFRPPQVERLTPGTDQTLTILGAGFTHALTIEVDGTPLNPSSHTVVDANTVTLDLPLVGLGTHDVVLRQGASSVGAEIEVVAANGPRLEVGSGDPLAVLVGGEQAPIRFSGVPGRTYLVLVSRSLVPSVHPRFMLDIGDGFGALITFRCGTIPPSGLVLLDVPVVVPEPETFYLQGVTLGLGMGVGISNLQSVQLVR